MLDIKDGSVWGAGVGGGVKDSITFIASLKR